MSRPRVAAFLALSLCLLPACGSDDDETSSGAGATKLAVEVTEPAKGQVSLEAPKSVKAGLVEMTFTNSGKGPHAAQLVGVDGQHTPARC